MSVHRSAALPAPRTLAQSMPLATAVVSLTTVLLLQACTAGDAVPAASAAPTVFPVRVQTIAATSDAPAGAIDVTGTLAGKEELALSFKVGGVIARVLVDPGQPVRAGQVLAELRPTEIDAQVASANEGRQKAERDLARVSRLYADSVATLEQLQDARTGLEVANNAYRVARFNADFAVIRAPGDGVVLTRAADPGQVVEPGRTVVSVRRTGRGMVVRIGLPDRDAVRVRLGDAADVRFDALADQRFTARVTERAATATPGTGDYAVELTLVKAPATLPSGLVTRVHLQPSATGASPAARGDVSVPLDALVDADADSAAVFVLRADGASVTRRPVKLRDVAEALAAGRVPIVSGLSGGETVVTAGTSRLVDGSKVRVITAPADRTVSDASPAWKGAR